MKPPSGSREDNRRSSARFLQEAQAGAQVKHDRVVKTYDLGIQGSYVYLVQELLVGESLDKLLKREPRLPLDVAIGFACDIAGGLIAFHEHGWIHRDIKPANIFVERTQQATLIDLGLAYRYVSEGESLTAEGKIVGTAKYMSPEQFSTSKVDFQSDQFSLAVMLYQSITGRHPFFTPDLEGRYAWMLAITSEPHQTITPHEVIGPSGFVRCLDRLNCCLDRMLAKKPGDRFPLMADVEIELRQILRLATTDFNLSPQDREPSQKSAEQSLGAPGSVAERVSEPNAKPILRRRLTYRSAVTGFAVVLLVGLGSSQVWPVRQDSSPTPRKVLDDAPLTMGGDNEKPATQERGQLVQRFTVYRCLPDKTEAQGEIGIDCPGLKHGEEFVVKASFAAPVYCYLMVLFPSGKPQVEYPPLPEVFDPPRPDAFDLCNRHAIQIFPDDYKVRLGVELRSSLVSTDEVGMAVVILLTAQHPVPSYSRLEEIAKGLPRKAWEKKDIVAAKGIWQWKNGKASLVDDKSGPTKLAPPLKEEPLPKQHLEAVCQHLSVNPQFTSVSALTFPVWKVDPPSRDGKDK